MTETTNQAIAAGPQSQNNMPINVTEAANVAKRFLLWRHSDVSGVSGVGIIAEGIQFHDKQCVISWFGKFHSLEIHPSIQQILDIHGHDGRTTIKWIDDKDE